MDIMISQGLTINAPQFFADQAFRRWLAEENTKLTWYRGRDIDEWSDVVVLVDPGLTGEGSDSDMPEAIWNAIVEACRTHLGPRPGQPHYMVRLTNLAH